MAKDRSTVATKKISNVTTEERNAFTAGQKVEYDGKLAKVVEFGFLELTVAPGQDVAFSDTLVATLQLPALIPGGKPEYAYHVPVEEITSLKDDPKRQRALEIEFNALMGDPVPTEPKPEGPAPVVRTPGQKAKVTKVEAAPAKKAKK